MTSKRQGSIYDLWFYQLPRDRKLMICGYQADDEVTDATMLEDWKSCSNIEKHMYYDIHSDEYYNLDNLEFYS